MAIEAAMEIFQLSGEFPREERYSLIDQIRRSSRSVCTNLAEAWRRRRYEAAFVAKLNDSETEAAETQVWLEFANRCRYLVPEICLRLDDTYDRIIAQLVRMIDDAPKWLLHPRQTT